MKQLTELLLVSGSPRRRELLDMIDVRYRVLNADIDETPLPNETPEALVRRLALGKAQAGRALAADGLPALGADTIVASANSRVMVHNPWTIAAGEASDFRGTADILDKFAADIADTYAEHTGRSSGYWRQVMDRSEYFSAAEALEVGLVDRVSGRSTKAAAKAEPLVAMRPAYAAYKASQQARRLKVQRLTRRP